MFGLVSKHLYRNIRTRHGTKNTSGAFPLLALFFFSILCRMIPFDVDILAYPDLPLGARCNTKPAPLAPIPVYPDETFLQRRVLPKFCSPES